VAAPSSEDLQRWLDALGDAAGAAAFVLDRAGFPRLMKGRLAAVLLESWQERSLFDVLVDQGEATEALHQVLSGQVPSTAVRLRGEGLDLESRIGPVHDAAGAIVELVGVSVEATEVAVLQRRIDYSRRFVAGVTHELKTPLGSILGYSRLLAGERFGPLNERQQAQVAQIATAGRQLLALIDDLLDRARLDADRLHLVIKEFQVHSAVQEAVGTLLPTYDLAEVALVSSVSPGLSVLADRRRSVQVLLNLLANSVRFTYPGGRVQVRARARRGVVEIQVVDTGVGIPAADLERIFEPFEQSGPPADAARQGTGLGLALSRELAQHMGGTLRVTSRPGRGSTFTLILPSA
jgi:signal transduction histidine kinase